MNDETLIRKNIDVWLQQYNDHDAAGLAAWYTKDCVYITPTGMALVGPAEIHQYFQESFKRSPAVGIKAQVEEFRMEKPDLAIARGTFEVTGMQDPNGKPMPIKGPWVTTFLMQEGRWVPLTHASAVTLETYVPVRA